MIKNKIKEIKELSKIIKVLKASGNIIGFTNGCFDIIHAGHVNYLEEAKERCDILIVAVNSDASVKKIKDKGRPLTKENDRINIAAALSSVTYVTLFNEKTPLKAIKTLRPNLLIKGADWDKKNIVGADFVKSYGGKIVTIPYLKGYSSTLIIKNIIKKFK